MTRHALAKWIILIGCPLFLFSVLFIQNHLVSGILSLLCAFAMIIASICESEKER